MENGSAPRAVKRSVGVTIFGVLLILFPVIGMINFARDLIYTGDFPGGEFCCYILMFLIPAILLARGIFRLKNWARLMCLWFFWTIGISLVIIGASFGTALSSEPEGEVILKVILFAVAVCAPGIFFLTRPAVKEQFL